MSSGKTSCVFCGNTSGKIHVFNQENLQKCVSIKIIRQQNNLSMNDVHFPEYQSEALCGFHSTCYSKFLAVNKKYKLANTIRYVYNVKHIQLI